MLENIFKEISEAYAILSDSEKKQTYDQHGHAGVDGKYSSDDIFQGGRGGGFNDIFESIFSRGGRRFYSTTTTWI